MSPAPSASLDAPACTVLYWFHPAESEGDTMGVTRMMTFCIRIARMWK